MERKKLNKESTFEEVMLTAAAFGINVSMDGYLPCCQINWRNGGYYYTENAQLKDMPERIEAIATELLSGPDSEHVEDIASRVQRKYANGNYKARKGGRK